MILDIQDSMYPISSIRDEALTGLMANRGMMPDS